jgi:hypothetical protein
MGEVCEFNIDFEQFDDIRAVVVHDECGAHEDVWFYRFDRLKRENVKLRELLAELYEEQCDECDRWKYRDRMRELFGKEDDGCYLV